MLKSKIETFYDSHSCLRIYQGDILRDLSFVIIGENEEAIELSFQYVVVLSQDCDLQQGSNLHLNDVQCDGECKLFNQFLHTVLIAPAFPAEILRSGKHLESIYNIKADSINSRSWKIVTQNQNSRYHYLPPESASQIPELVIDFKAYYALSYDYFLKKHKDCYLATVNELFRERLSQRFANYINRIGLPELKK